MAWRPHTKHAVDKLAFFVVPVGRLAKAFKVAVVIEYRVELFPDLVEREEMRALFERDSTLGLDALLVFDSVARHGPFAIHRPEDLPFRIGYTRLA